jgi:hypothetical protein
MKAPRCPQLLHSQTDQRCGSPEAQKRFVDPHFGHDMTPRLLPLCFDLVFFPPLWDRFDFFAFFSTLLFGSLGFGARSASFVIGLILLPLRLYVHFPFIKV